MRWPALWLSSLALAAPAEAAVKVADSPLLGMTEWRGKAATVTDSGDATEPFEVVRTTGRGLSAIGGFGDAGAEFPDITAGADGRLVVGWARSVSGGNTLFAAPFGQAPLPPVQGTGPGRLAAGAGAIHVAYPDRDGNATVASFPADRGRVAAGPAALTSTAPFRRHLPLAAAAADGGVLVLDLIQERGRTELRLLGPGAPAAPVLSVRALRHFPARMAVAGDRVAVAWLDRGRARLAVARLGGEWVRRTLPGRGRGDGAPAPAFVDGALRVAYTQRGEVYVWGGGVLRRLTRTRGVERDAMAAGEFVGWTRRDAGRRWSAWVHRIR